MERSDITHLASLARIKLSEAEVDSLLAELPKIVEYVSVVDDIAAQDSSEPQPGARYNVLRPDEISNQPEEFTAAILEQMPATDERFMKVKKIISQDK